MHETGAIWQQDGQKTFSPTGAFRVRSRIRIRIRAHGWHRSTRGRAEGYAIVWCGVVQRTSNQNDCSTLHTLHPSFPSFPPRDELDV